MLTTRKLYGRKNNPRDGHASLSAIADQEQRPVALIDLDTGKVLRRVRPTYRTIEDVKKRNKAAGQHWFDVPTLRFFSSRVQSAIYPTKDGRAFFVSSERGPLGRRMYTVRVAKPDGTIDTCGEFQSFETGRAAHAAARKAAQS